MSKKYVKSFLAENTGGRFGTTLLEAMKDMFQASEINKGSRFSIIIKSEPFQNDPNKRFTDFEATIE